MRLHTGCQTILERFRCLEKEQQQRDEPWAVKTKVKGYKRDRQRRHNFNILPPSLAIQLLIRTSLVKDKHNSTSLGVEICSAAHWNRKDCPSSH
jgi:hypothetical protein